MGEFEDTLGRILGDPSALARIAQLAQSLGGPAEGDGVPSGGPPPVPPPPPSAPSPGPTDGTAPPGPPPAPPNFSGTAEAAEAAGAAGLSGLSGLTGLSGLSGLSGLLDTPRLRRLLPLLLEGRQNTEARRFLYALRPYLSPRRQENVERALQLARLLRVGRRFLSEEGGTAETRNAGQGGTAGPERTAGRETEGV